MNVDLGIGRDPGLAINQYDTLFTMADRTGGMLTV